MTARKLMAGAVLALVMPTPLMEIKFTREVGEFATEQLVAKRAK